MGQAVGLHQVGDADAVEAALAEQPPADLGVATTDLGITMSAFFLVFAFGQLLVGPLSDRYGRRPVVLGGLAVFVAGLIAPRLAARAGSGAATLGGLVLALAGGAALLTLGAPSFPAFLAATAVFLFGMGLANPLGTALALAPFGRQAGLASALLGFLQMGGAGIGVALATGAGGDPAVALGAVQAAFGLAAVLVFAGGLRTRPKPVPASAVSR